MNDKKLIYYVIKVPKEIAVDGFISLLAVNLDVTPNGDLIARNIGHDGIQYNGLILPRGSWNLCYKANMIDGGSQVTNHWNREEPENNHDPRKEQEKMKPSLRYKIMQRDNFECVICGASKADGAKLHVDHIIPVSKGGFTTEENLQTLCSDCNIGKGSKV